MDWGTAATVGLLAAALASVLLAWRRAEQDVVALHQGDTAADSSGASQTGEAEEPRALPSPSPDLEAGPSNGEPPSTPRRKMPPDAATLLVRSIASGDRGPRDASPGEAVIWGAQKELVLVAEMLLAIDTRFREAWPEPPAIGNVLTALSDRILAGLELLSHERGVAPPPPPAAEDDDEPPPSSDSGGGPLTH